MTESKFDESVWERLSPVTREICQMIGGIPLSVDNFNQMYEEDAEVALKELREHSLADEMTFREELEQKTKGFSQEGLMKKRTTLEKQELSMQEKEAEVAFRILRDRDEVSLNSMRLRLKPDFAKFVETKGLPD